MLRQMHLNAFLRDSGHHEIAWRLPESDSALVTDVRFFQKMAQAAERAKLDSVFIADTLHLNYYVAKRPNEHFDPMLLATAIAACTEQIGLIATVSTTFSEPFNVARAFATLDFISGGRAGWNVVTTGGEDAAKNFGLESLPDPVERYRRADEFLEVAYRLWDSWSADAVLADKTSGVYADPAKVRTLDHVGDFFSVRGPLNLSRGPQGSPVIVQAGSSGPGMAFAAKHAEAIFTAMGNIEDARTFYAEIKRQAAGFGRNPDEVVVLPGLVTIIGSTEEEAKRRAQELDDLVVLDLQLKDLAKEIGLAPEDIDLDAPLPDTIRSFEDNKSSRYELIVTLARTEKLTVRELLIRFGRGRGHNLVVGTPEQVADHMVEWFSTGACDGFNVMPAALPAGLNEFLDHVVPILQNRGLFRREYEGTTLRARIGVGSHD